MKANDKSWLKVAMAVSLSLLVFAGLCAILIIAPRHGQIEWAKVSDKQKDAIALIVHSFCSAAYNEEGLYFPPRNLTFTMAIPRKIDRIEIDNAYIGVGFIDLFSKKVPSEEQRDRLTKSIHQWSQNIGFVEKGQEGTQYALYVSEYDIDWVDPNEGDEHMVLITVKRIQKKPISIPSVSAPERSVAELVKAAKSGKPEDFYQLGLSYLSGGAGIFNLVEAYYWLSRAATSDIPQHTLYANTRNQVRSIMTPSQLEKAESLLREHPSYEP